MRIRSRFSRFFLWPAASLVFYASTTDLRAQSLTDLFQKGKNEFKLGSYRTSLQTFDALEEQSRLPGNERIQEKLEPIIAFYRGASLAALGENEPAKKEFLSYLAAFPGAHLDPAVFPKSVIAVFDAVREENARQTGRTPAVAAEDGSLAAEYHRYRASPDHAPTSADASWMEGAIRFLMTREEKGAWQRIDDAAQRAEFVTRFWQRRDPTPLTPENEFRDEIERRIQFADAHFVDGEKRGSATDRGMVFMLLGPPSYIGQRPLNSGDDSIQAARDAPTQQVEYQRGRRVVQLIPRDPLTAQKLQGTREVWYYRRDRLPKAVRFTEVDFEFITKKGFGTAVLQRDHQALTALEEAARTSLPSAN